MRQHLKNIIKKIEWLSGRHGAWTVFSDFIAMAAISIRNSTSLLDREEKEREYLSIAKKYKREELDKFGEILGELVMGLEKEKTDILGMLFMELGLSNKWKGQFFTPMSIAELMAEISMNQVKRIIEEEGYITVNEPAVGAGAMIIGLAKVLERHGYNYQKQMVVIAQDIDIKSVYMSYIQLSLLGIPAKVMHANTLTLEVYEIWDTPFYVLGMWNYRLMKDREKQSNKQVIKFNTEENGQLTLF